MPQSQIMVKGSIATHTNSFVPRYLSDIVLSNITLLLFLTKSIYLQPNPVPVLNALIHIHLTHLYSVLLCTYVQLFKQLLKQSNGSYSASLVLLG